ncbi:hypothetical protein N431DRAFT_379282 [Stipitochalara longipes BDJ]|nr:hypothetical protein N431DRAFT_379282 [Stipitochalara longipes BDJ]
MADIRERSPMMRYQAAPKYSGGPLPHLLSLKEAASPKENWTGLSDVAKRRRIQNRLNQRASRNRKYHCYENLGCDRGSRSPYRHDQSPLQSTKQGRVEVQFWTVVQGLNGGNGESILLPIQNPSSAIAKPTRAPLQEPAWALTLMASVEKGDLTKAKEELHKNSSRSNQNPGHPPDVCTLSNFEIQATITHFEYSILRNYFLGSPAVDDLLTLIPFNMYRGIISNAHVLGYDLEKMSPEDTISRFCNQAAEGDWQCPPSLRPTLVQLRVPHHPWLDLFPIPQMRDNMILAGSSLNEEELCVHLVGFTAKKAGPGVAIWGEAWDPACWEVTESFFQHWRWLLEGCDDLLRSSNMWRAKRGEKPLPI